MVLDWRTRCLRGHDLAAFHKGYRPDGGERKLGPENGPRQHIRISTRGNMTPTRHSRANGRRRDPAGRALQNGRSAYQARCGMPPSPTVRVGHDRLGPSRNPSDVEHLHFSGRDTEADSLVGGRVQPGYSTSIRALHSASPRALTKGQPKAGSKSTAWPNALDLWLSSNRSARIFPEGAGSLLKPSRIKVPKTFAVITSE